jgi:hypothetical protein
VFFRSLLLRTVNSLWDFGILLILSWINLSRELNCRNQARAIFVRKATETVASVNVGNAPPWVYS